MGLYVQVFTASSNRDDCTKASISNMFINSAKKVQEGGIFVFYFAGHGCLIEQSNKCILAPANFAGIEDLNTGISGDDLIEWLHKAGCNASHVLFIFDCCYAGHLGQSLIFGSTQKIKPSLFVMCGCAAGEICISFNELEHSCFTFFLLDYLKTNSIVGESGETGQFDVKQAIDKITELCSRFSSLIVMYNEEEGELQSKIMNPILFPQITEQCVTVVPEDDVISLLKPFFEKNSPTDSPDPEVELKSIDVKRSLYVLYPKASSCEALQKGIVSALFHSSCSIQCKYDKPHVNKRNLFLTIAIKVSHAINFGNLTLNYLTLGLKHYICAIKGDIDKTDLWHLYKDIMKSISHVPNEDSGSVPSHMQTKVCSYSTCLCTYLLFVIHFNI